MYADHRTPTLARFQFLLATSPLQESVHTFARLYQSSLNEWVDYRRNVIRVLSEDCAQLEAYRRNSLITTSVGSSIGFLSSGLTIYGIARFAPLAIAASIVGAAGSAASGASQYIKWENRKEKLKKLKEYFEKDRELLAIVMKNDRELVDLIRRIMSNESFQQELQHEFDRQALSMSIGCATVTVSRGATTGLMILKAASLRVSLEYALHAITGIGMTMDAFILAICVTDLKTDSQLVAELRTICTTMENGLEEVLKQTQSTENNEINIIEREV